MILDKQPAIIKTGNHAIVAGGSENLTGFFLPGELSTAFQENNWTVQEMVEVLCDIVRNKDVRHIEKRDGSIVDEPVTTARERMAAISMLDKKAKESLIMGGLIVKDRLTLKKQLEDGTEAEYNMEEMRITQEGSSRLKSTLALLEGASKAEGDEIIDVEVNKNASTGGNESSSIRCDGSSGGGPSLLPRQPRGSHSDNGSGRPRTNDGPGSNSGGGDGVQPSVHGVERSDATTTRRQSSHSDEGPTKGAKDERGGRIPVQPGRSGEGQVAGSQGGKHRDGDQPDPVSPRRPVVPGESEVKRTNWWEPGIPRRAPDSDPGSLRDCATAESSLDRLKRIERAREQAAQAAAGYLERREKNKRARHHAPGDPNEPRPGNGPGEAPNPA